VERGLMPATPAAQALALWNAASTAADMAAVLEATTAAAEIEAGDSAAHCRERLALLLLQSGAPPAAEEVLRRLGMTHRLALPCFLPQTDRASLDAAAGSGVAVVESALPARTFAALQVAFGSGSSFWSEHDYFSPETGYFSYVEPLPLHPSRNKEETRDASIPEEHGSGPRASAAAREVDAVSSPPPPPRRRLLGQAVRRLRDLAAARFPEAAGAAHAEWWAHWKPFHAGTELHYDRSPEQQQ
jgi:hypothetical protein